MCERVAGAKAKSSCEKELSASSGKAHRKHSRSAQSSSSGHQKTLCTGQTVKIYTDWANHYLEKAKFKRFIQDLQVDVCDGVLLADVIEAVTAEKVKEIARKPKTAGQMIENIKSSLVLLKYLGVNLDGITAKDVKDGNLKTILGLFFSLSRYKQQQKSVAAAAQTPTKSNLRSGNTTPSSVNMGRSADTSSRLPAPSSKGNRNKETAFSGIPSPVSSIHSGSNKGLVKNLPPSQAETNKTAPSTGIPTPGRTPPSSTPTTSLPQPKSLARTDKASSRGVSGLPRTTSLATATSQNTLNSSSIGKNSMLDKFKFFKDKDKGKFSNKRTSSSSGFSSARSERSDSSTSLCSEPKGGTTSSTASTSPDHHESSSSLTSSIATSTASATSSPKLAIKALAKKTFRKTSSDAKSKPVSSDNKKTVPQKESRLKPLSKNDGRNIPKPKLQNDSAPPHVSSIPKSESDNKILSSKLKSDFGSLKARGQIPTRPAKDQVKPLELDNPIKQSKISSLTPKVKSSASNNSIRSSSSKDNLSSGPPTETSSMQSSINSQVLTAGGGSAIPKPTAAVKGTTKIQEDEKLIKPTQVTPPTTKPAQNQVIESNNQPTVDIIPNRDVDKSHSQQSSNSNRSETLPKAMVSPMMSTKTIKNDNKTSNEEDRAVRNIIETTFDKTDKVITREICPRKTAKGGDESDDVVVNIKPMNPISRASHYGYISGHLGILSNPSKNLAPSIHIPTYRMQQQSDGGNNVLNNYPYNSSSAMKLHSVMRKGLADHNKSIDDFSETDLLEMNGGYMSDDDMLRANNNSFVAADINSGYMSEGGASLYARTNRFNGGVKLKDDYPNGYSFGPSIANDDSFDDSSSLSSGISDTIAELGTDDFAGDRNLYGNLRRHNIKDGKLHVLHGKKSSSSMQAEAQVAKPSSSQKQKADSSMQTDSSAFRQLAYKKLESKVMEGKVELRRGKSDLSSSNLRAAKERSANVDKTLTSPRSRRKMKNEEASANGSSSKHKGDDPERKHRSEVSKKSSRSTGTSSSGNGQQSKRMASASGSSSSRSKQRQDLDYSTTLTAQVPGVQRTDKPPTLDKKGKVKVCGSTQTSTHDLHANSQVYSDGEYSLGRKHKHYVLMNSSGIHSSSPTPSVGSSVSGSEYHRGQRLSISSEHSSPYSVPYNTMSSNGGQSHYAWLRGREAVANSSSASRSHYDYIGSGLTEAESIESLSNVSNTLHAQLQHARANSLTHAKLLLHQRELAASVTPGGSPRLSRSNSIRSTKSEKMYPSMLTRSEDVDNLLLSSAASVSGATNHANNSSQPTSPSSQPYGLLYPDLLYLHGTGRFTFPLSPNNAVHRSSSASPYMSGVLSKVHSKDDELHGSALSLASTASSIYTTPEEKHAHEIRKLRRELEQAHDKVHTLTSHLNTNGHVVAAFEQSLANMTSRLQHLTATAEQKDSELNELRNTIESLRNKSAEAGLVLKYNGESSHLSPHISRRHTFNNSDKNGLMKENTISRQLSTDSVSSLSSACSINSSTSKQSSELSRDKKKKKNWFRSSIGKAFTRNKKNRKGSVSDVEDMNNFYQSDTSTPSSPLLLPANQANVNQLLNSLKSSQSSSAIYEKDDDTTPEAITDLKKQLREKDMVLTDIRLEALTSAHQLESMKETVNKMRSQMINLKQDNERLQRMVTSKSLASSQNSLQASTNRNSIESLDKKLSASEHSGPSSIDMILGETQVDRDGKRVLISVFLGCHGDYNKYSTSQKDSEVLIGSVFVSSKTKWDLLDNIVRRAFKEYVLRVDPVSNLGLNAESVQSYHIGKICRSNDSEPVELLPCGYLIGEENNIKVLLRGTSQSSVDALAFDSLIPKSIIQRYVSLLTEHRRIILCGPSGTGKTYLAQKLAEFLVLKSGKELNAGAVATFSVDHKSAKELRQYLGNVAEQCENNAADLPSVIILDNLHHVGSLAEVFNGFLNAKYLKCPYIIGTMNQATCSTTNLQLHHNFRWVLCANHMEPVKGFLGRYLKKKLVEHEAKNGSRNADLNKIIDWMPRVWQHLNKFLETHSSSDVTIGPRLFLSCPVDVNGSQVWFTDLWNYSLVPYLLEAVREGLQLHGRRAPWEDPAEWVLNSYPWPNAPEENSDWPPQLLRLRPEDVGYDGISIQNGPGACSVRSGTTKTGSSGNQNDADGDPLLNMLIRLQEAASYPTSHISINSSRNEGDLSEKSKVNTNGLESTL